jgi:Proteasome assembly chaperone 4
MTNEEIEPSARRPIEISFPLPKAPGTRIHLRLTISSSSILLFLTTVENGNVSATIPLGSFVYAIPDVRPTTSQFTTAMVWLTIK